MALSRLLYFSRTTIDTSDGAAIRDLVVQAGRNNAQNNITGVLACSDDAFIQLLEGTSEALSALLGELYRDPRHIDLQVVDFRRVTDRVTRPWAMGMPSLESRFTFESLSYDRLAKLTYEDLLSRMSRYESNPTLCIESQIDRQADAILL